MCLSAWESMSGPCRKGQQGFVPIPALLQTKLLQQTILSRGLLSSPQILVAHSRGEQHSGSHRIPGWLEMNCITYITPADVTLLALLATLVFLHTT